MKCLVLHNTPACSLLCTVAALLFLVILPVSADSYTIAPVIDQGATVYIGEMDLNVTHALNQARGTVTPEDNESVPTLTTIGWWPWGTDPWTTSPVKTLDLSTTPGGYRTLVVVPSSYVGFTGTWYLLNAGGTAPFSTRANVFTVRDPYLDLRIRNFDQDMDVTGRSTTRGDLLGFRIDTNMQGALSSRYRSPVYNGTDDGYIAIRVRNESGFEYTGLADTLNTPHDLLRQNISQYSWTWGDAANPTSPYPWATGVNDGSGGQVYAEGTYLVWAEARLNYMKDNYKQGGADYIGKTISQACTVTLLNESLKIEANHDSVPRGYRFSATITGRPKTAYYLWVNNTGAMTGESGDQPPAVLVSAPVYQDPYDGSDTTIGSHAILGGGGKTILEDVPPSAGNVSRNEYYAKVVTSASGTASVEFQTSPATKPGIYTLRVEKDTFTDEVPVEVVAEIRPGPVDPVTEDRVIYHPLLNPDVPVPVNNDLKRISREGTVFIGEDGLDIAEALAAANALGSVPPVTSSGTLIGWWPSPAYVKWVLPSKTADLDGRESSFGVSPSEFVGYTGTWYLVSPSNGAAVLDSGDNPIPVLTVQDPSLDIKIWDIDINADVTGKSVPQGERLTFRIDTNMYPAFDTRYRPDITDSTPGSITLVVKDEENARYNYLYQNNTTTVSLTGQRVKNQPYWWGGGESTPASGAYWSTDLLDRNNYYFYPVGTYVVWAESLLNNMKVNYRQGGADYTGKTVSQAYTITLVTDTVRIETNKDTVTRGKPFAVTVSGRPAGVYYLWVEDTSDLTGGANNQPPMIALYQEKVALDSPTGPAFPIGAYQYRDGGGETIKMNVGTDPVTNGTRYYARIIATTSGTRMIEFETGRLTRAGTFTIRVENASGGRYLTDEVNVTVKRGTPAAGIGAFRPSTRSFILKNGTARTVVSWGVSTDLPVSSDWDGDGLSEVGVFRPSTHSFILKNGTQRTTVNWGLDTDLPVSGDWNGDGMGDVAVFRPSNHRFILKNGTARTVISWGVSTDLPVSGDWNGDGMGDVGVFRPSTHMFILKNGTQRTTVNWGLDTDLPVSGDWNGDGMGDVGVFRPSNHKFFLKNGTETMKIIWGTGTDIPVAGAWS
jgi:hypothetical protein